MAQTLNAGGHERWRRMVGKWFTARRMQALVPKIEATTERLIDGMRAHRHPADLMTHLAFPLPVFVICDMLGVPENDRDDFKHWSDVFLNLSQHTRAEMDAAHRDFAAYMAGLIAEKRTEPQDDLLSQLIAATDAEGRPMSDGALAATGQALPLAGHETTAGFITTRAAVLLADRARWERLLEDRSLIRSAVEEVLRFEPYTGFGMLRYVHEDTEIRSGAVLPGGTTVVCSMAAANRDTEAFDGAEQLDLGRTPNTHLAFGAGAHSCLGQPLARTELQTVLGVLLRRLPTLALAVEPAELPRVEGLLTTDLLRPAAARDKAAGRSRGHQAHERGAHDALHTVHGEVHRHGRTCVEQETGTRACPASTGTSWPSASSRCASPSEARRRYRHRWRRPSGCRRVRHRGGARGEASREARPQQQISDERLHPGERTHGTSFGSGMRGSDPIGGAVARPADLRHPRSRRPTPAVRASSPRFTV
ncbi:cytochrome P450 [Streptomyces alanosinicus]|uniref:Cytochrome P450 n=1 Tax=Streptomyces alanosinicus TaxID=68171 RepID=A0A918YI61_9ACTN|nr:cytochrome P450 [Streptomyces alanosinicus]GHE04858.1 hypothetical protein GCM10010339_38020 [Streptomyces alanosinicus]